MQPFEEGQTKVDLKDQNTSPVQIQPSLDSPEALSKAVQEASTEEDVKQVIDSVSNLLTTNPLNFYLFHSAAAHSQKIDFITNLLIAVLSKKLLLSDKILSSLEAMLSLIFSTWDVKKRHLETIYRYLGSPEFDSLEYTSRTIIFERVGRILKIVYNYLENKSLKPNIYYLFPKSESQMRVTLTRQACKIKPDESFCLSMWVFLHKGPQNSDIRQLVGVVNQDSEGMKLVVKGENLELILTKKSDKTLQEETMPLGTLQIGIWNYLSLVYENRSWQQSRQFFSLQVGEKEAVTCNSDILADWSKTSMAFTISVGGDLFGQVSALVFTKKFNKALNSIYKDHYTLKLAHKRNISYQNEFFEKNQIKDILYIFSGINSTIRRRQFKNCELTTGLEVEFVGDCCVVQKSQHLENIDIYGGFEPLLMLLTRTTTVTQIKTFFEIFYKLVKMEKASPTSLVEKKIVKALAGFLEPLAEQLDEKVEQILSDLMAQEMDIRLRKSFVKNIFLNFSLIYRTPQSFQKFAAQTVANVYANKGWAMHHEIALDWIIKYLTVYSILDTTEEPAQSKDSPATPMLSASSPFLSSRDQLPVNLATKIEEFDKNYRKDSRDGQTEDDKDITPSMKGQYRERFLSTSNQSYNYAIDILQQLIDNNDPKEPWIEEGVDVLLKCICCPNLSASIQSDYLSLVRRVLEHKLFDTKYGYRFLPNLTSSLLIFFKHTLYARNRSTVVSLLNLACRRVQETPMSPLCSTLSDILQRRALEDTIEVDQHSREWSILLNALERFMLGLDPDFSKENKNFIGENVKILNPEVLSIIYEIFPKLDRDNKQKVVQDLIMLFGFDKQNAITVFKRSHFFDWIVEIIFLAELAGKESPEQMAEHKGLKDLSMKIIVVYLTNIILYSQFDRLCLLKFLATFEKKIQARSKDMQPEAFKPFKSSIEGIRAKILSQTIDAIAREDKEARVSSPVASSSDNLHFFVVRVVNYLFSYISDKELEEEAAREELEDQLNAATGNLTPEKFPSTPNVTKRFNFPSSEEPNTPGAGVVGMGMATGFTQVEEVPSPNVALDKSKAGDQGRLFDRCYNYEKYREFARIDPVDNVWIDEAVFDSLRRLMDNYFKYDCIQFFITEVNEGKATQSQDLGFRAKTDKSEYSLSGSILLSLMFGVDWAIEKRNIDRLKACCSTLERLFVNILALTEIERKILKKSKYRYLDSLLVFIQIFLTLRRNMLLESNKEENTELAQVLSLVKNNIWKGLILASKFDFEKLLGSKETGGILKVFNILKPASMNKIVPFVDELFFKKFMLTDQKKEDFRNQMAQMYSAPDLYGNFAELAEKGELRILLENHLVPSRQTQTAEFYSRGETVNEMYNSIHEENKLLRNRKKIRERLRAELEEKTKELLASLEENFMNSALNAEMVMRDCRWNAQTVLLKERDLSGLWSTPELRLFSQIDTPFNLSNYSYSMPENKYFTWELHPFTSHKFSRPFLKGRLKPYWNDKLVDANQDKDTSEMNIFDRGSNKNRKIKKKYVPNKIRRNLKLYTQRIFSTTAGLLSGAKTSGQEENKVIYSRSCEILSKFTIYNGLVMVTKRQIIFCTDNTKSKNYLSILNVELEKYDKVKQTWNLSDIVEIQRRRLVQRKTGIEIFFLGGYSVLINMPPDQNDIQEFHDLLMSLRESLLFHSPFSKIRSTRNVKLLEANKYTEKWMAGELSNYHYLMLLNNYAGRSFHDLSQYHVFPWITMLYKGRSDEKISNIEKGQAMENNELDFNVSLEDFSKEDTLALFEFRNLNKPIGALGTPSRLKTYQEKYATSDHFSNTPNYHYGSHYSSPAIVLHYLIRLSPFTEGAKAIQNGHFDLPDRLFFSVNHTFRNAMEEMSDVRELIPEFYSLPEFLLNINKLDLGVCQTGERVNNVYLPKWSQANPYFFIYMMSRLLESPISTLTMKNWIDLVFGYKQHGEEAEKSLNTFYYLTYEDQVDLDQIRESDRQGIETQIVHFGQTPSKLFTKPHPGPTSSNSLGRVRSINFHADSIQVYAKKGAPANPDSAPFFSGELKSCQDFIPNTIYKLESAGGKKVVCICGNQILNYLWELSLKAVGENTEISDLPPEEKMPFKFYRANRQRDIIFDFYSENTVLKDKDSNFDFISHPTLMLEETRVLLIGGYTSGLLRAWHLDKKSYKEYHNHSETVSVVKGDKEEKFVVSGSVSGVCIVWDVKEADLVRRFSIADFESSITDLFIQDESKLLAIGSEEGKMCIYNLYTRELIKILFHPDFMPINKLVLSLQPFGTLTFYSEMDGRLLIYSVNGQFLASKKFKGSKLTDLQVSTDANNMDFIAFSTTTGDIGVANLPFMENFKAYVVSKRVAITSLVIMKKGEAAIAGDVLGNMHILFNDSNMLKDFKAEGGAQALAQSEKVN